MTATQIGAGGAALSAAGATAAAQAANGGGRSPPFRGRTMKEYEEMLAQLRKENFNLKLRLYFLEERGLTGAPGEGCGEAGAALRLELEQLRRDAADKQQLLCEAARAVELLEEQHREQLRAARAAAAQALADAQQARAHAQQLAAEAQRAREEAEAELTTMRKAAAEAAAEAAVETERLRMELVQARDDATESARVARAAAAAVRRSSSSPATSPPLSPRSPLSRSPEGGGCGALRGAVERAQAQLSALEAELGAVRAELRRQTEARTAAERGLAEGRAVHAKSLQTVQALARLCKERGREAESLRARLNMQLHDKAGAEQLFRTPLETEERGCASGDEGVATPRPSPAGSPAPLPPPPSPTPSAATPTPMLKMTLSPDAPRMRDDSSTVAAASTIPRGDALDVSTSAAAALLNNVTLRRDVERQHGTQFSGDEHRLLLLLRAQLGDKNEQLRALAAERDVLSVDLVSRLQALQVRSREQDEALVTRDAQLRAAEERAKRLEEELARVRSENGNRSDADSTTPTPPHTTKNCDEFQVTATEDEKDHLITRLRAELRQRTANLQELVNKELWDKNRQIERLQARLARLGSPAAAAVGAPIEALALSAPPPGKQAKGSPPRTPSSPRAPSPSLPSAAERTAGEEDGDEEEALRRRLDESVRERACLAAQLEELRRRVHDANISTCSESACGAEPEAAAATRAALARAEAGRRDALAACAALARRLDALARALPPLLRRHYSGHRSRADRRSSASASGAGVGGGGGGSGRRLRALERALSAAARAARALASVEGAAEFALQETEATADVSTLGLVSVEAPTTTTGARGAATASPSSHTVLDSQQTSANVNTSCLAEQEESVPVSLTRASESEVDAWSEPDRTVSLARVGLSPLSDRRAAAAAAAAAAVSASSDEELDEAASRASRAAGDPWASDDTIESSAEKLIAAEGGELHVLRSRVAELETRVCEKDNELLEQQCALLEMRNTYTARCLQAEGQLSELLAQVRQVQADAEVDRRNARDQREAEAERRWRAADAALLRTRDAAAVAQSRAALERTQLLGERVRLERALRREEAAAASAARAHRHERRHLQEQVLALQSSNRSLSRQLSDLSTLQLSPPCSPSSVQSGPTHLTGGSPRGAPSTTVEQDLGVCPLSSYLPHDNEAEVGSIGSGLDVESLGSGSPPPGSPWLLAAPAPRSLPTFSRQHSVLSTGYASAGDCGPASPQTCGGSYSWVTTRPPGEPSHGAGSPDLGIESDAGRFSSLEPLSSHCGSCDQEPTQGLCGFQGTEVETEFARLQKENSNLRRNLSRTKKLLEATVTQLSSSNQLKRQMEMTICKQLNKTHSVLKQAKADCEVPVEPVK